MKSFSLSAAHEWLSCDPYGHSKPQDLSQQPVVITDERGTVRLCAPRNGYVSFYLLVSGKGTYQLSTHIKRPLQVDLYRAWYHRMHSKEQGSGEYWPDALIPVSQGQEHSIPSIDNQIPGQTMQAFWVDIFVPASTTAGEMPGRIVLKSKSQQVKLDICVTVQQAVVPEQPCITMDHNSYGARWLWDTYPAAFKQAESEKETWHTTINLLHHYYRLVHEHRGLLHNLGYGHSGDSDPIYTPRSTGRGRDKRLTDWYLYDALMGPLLEGTAFNTAAPGMPPPRRPANPIETIYTPITPNWPASYLWWGEPGYKVEFNRCIRQFDAHLQEKGWRNSRIEFFLNHKKRYRWFGWDGDEVKDIKDMAYHHELVKMWEEAIADSPAKWVYRMDASWQMAYQFKIMSGHDRPNFWVTGSFHRWYQQELREVAERGDTVWWYGGTPAIDDATSSILSNAYETWARGLDGFCAWLTTQPDDDPWFDCQGNKTALLYPGERFGIAGPLPSIRLKVQRNGIQDIDLINAAAQKTDTMHQVRTQLAKSIPITLWTQPPRTAQELPPEDWSSRNLAQEHEPEHSAIDTLDPTWWQALRTLALSEEAEQ